MEIIVLVIFWVLLSLICGSAAASRGQSYFEIFILSVFFSPIVGYLHTLATPINHHKLNKQRIEDGTHVACQHCMQAIIKGATICQFCGQTTTATDHA